MKGFNMSNLHLPPIKKVEVKRRHYRAILVITAFGVWMVHEHHPEYEMHMTFLVNCLFALDPTA